jgi:hypothetical protein
MTGIGAQSLEGRIQKSAIGTSPHVKCAALLSAAAQPISSLIFFDIAVFDACLQKLSIAHQRGSAFAVAVELIELGVL